MTPIEALRHQAEVRPNQAAFTAGEEVWTYRRLADVAETLARGLRARGIQAGDRVALHMANVPELAVSYYACFSVGAIAAPLNIRLKAAELRPLLQRLRPALYLGQAALYPLVAGIGPDILGTEARFTVGVAENDRAQPWAGLAGTGANAPALHAPDADAPSVLLSTSGTSGQPKLVAHTPGTLSASAEALAHVGLKGGQVALGVLPMMHMSGLCTFLACVRLGIPVVLQERFDPGAALNAIEKHRCSWIGGLPFMFAELLRCQTERARDITSLRFCMSGGDVCPPDLQQKFSAVFGVPLHTLWGSTEAVGALTYGVQAGPVSRSLPGTEVLLVDDAGRSVLRGDDGELLLRAPSLAAGYWTGPGQVESLLQDGWFHTGDVMRQGEGDDLWFSSRRKEIIVRGGSNISPAEVEQVLMGHPAVRDAAVFGVQDAVLGQRVAALVQLTNAVSDSVLDDIRASAMARLADYKVPERLHVVSAVPRNSLGKVDRTSLAATVSDTIARR